MRASDLIRELQAEIGIYGDLEVLIERNRRQAPLSSVLRQGDEFILSDDI